MRKARERMVVTEDHIKLMRRVVWRWEDCGFGAPAVDCKRPYGNSDALDDIADIIGIEPEERDGRYEMAWSAAQEERMHQLHRDVLQILIAFTQSGDLDRFVGTWRNMQGDWGGPKWAREGVE